MMKKKKEDTKIKIPSPQEVEQFAGDTKKEAGRSESVDHKETTEVEPVLEPEEEIDWKDRFLRAKADLQNLHRRLMEERQAAVRYANADIAKSILDVIDDFERTLEATGNVGNNETLVAGIKLIYEKLLKALKDHHIEPIEALGKPFDPTRHAALMQQSDPDHPPNTVIQEVQKGYILHDRVIRPARVIVSKPKDKVEDEDSQQVEAET